MPSVPDPSQTSTKSYRLLWILVAVLSGITLAYRLWNRLQAGGSDLLLT